MRGLMATHDLDRATIDRLLDRADHFAHRGYGQLLAGSVVGLLFYSDSLRTRVGFEVAAARLGARTFVVLGARHTPVMAAAESALDAVRSIAGWCDAICLRHPDATVPRAVAGLVDIPIINCGNGEDEHPTQALIDIYAMRCLRGSIDGVRVAIVGDLVGMRAAHSLVGLLSRYRDVFIRCIAPPGLAMPPQYLADLDVRDVEESTDLKIDDVDFVYVAGLPRHTQADVSDEDRARLSITRDVLRQARPSMRVLCPLPRIDEIAADVDPTPAAAYFEQSRLGLWMRMAILVEWVSRGPQPPVSAN